MIYLVLSLRVEIVQLYIRTLLQSQHYCIVDRLVKIRFISYSRQTTSELLLCGPLVCSISSYILAAI